MIDLNPNLIFALFFIPAFALAVCAFAASR